MIIELLIILTHLFVGSILVRALGFRGWIIPFLGFIVGLSVHALIGLLQILTPLSTNPVLALFIGVVTASTILIRSWSNPKLSPIKLSPILASIFVSGVLVQLFWTLHLFNYQVDTFSYLEMSSILFQDKYDAVENLVRISKRLIAVPFIHSSALIGGEVYLRSAMPLISLSLLASFAWMLREGLKKSVENNRLHLLIFLGLLLLLTNNRFVFHSFNINGHLFFAALLLIIAGCSWLIARKIKTVPTMGLIGLICIIIPALVVTRTEASIIAGLALIPLVLDTGLDWRKRILPVLTLGISMILWQSFVSYSDYRINGGISLQNYGLLLAGIGITALTPFLRWKFLVKNKKIIPNALEAFLWVMLVIFAYFNPSILITSINATIQNTVFGSWGWSLVVLGFLFLSALIIYRTKSAIYLRFPITTFVIAGFLFGYLRDGAYRVGDGDSFNRMLIQIVPLVVFFVIVSIATGKPRLSRLSVLKQD